MTKRHKEEDTFTVVDRRRTLSDAECEEIEIKALGNRFPKAEPTIPEILTTNREQILATLITDLPRTYDDPRPLGENCLIKANAKQTIYRGTEFVIPDAAQESPNMGVVVAIGPRVNGEDMKPGDLVTFSRYNAEDIDVDGEVYKLVSIHDIKLRQAVTFAVARNAN